MTTPNKKKLPAGIDRLPSGKYRARFRDRRHKQHTGIFELLEDAVAYRESARTAVRQGTFIDARAGEQSFGAFAQEWIDASDWKDTSRSAKRNDVARIVAVIGDTELADFDELAVKRTRKELERKFAPSTVKVTMGVLNAVLRAAYRSRRIAYDPTIGAQSRSRARMAADDAVGRVAPEQVPTREEVAAIWQAAPAEFRAAVALGSCGLRVGEVLGLGAPEVDVEGRYVKVEWQAQRMDGGPALTRPKGEKSRRIRIPSMVALELRRHLRDYGNSGLLFPGRRAPLMDRTNFYRDGWYPALAAAGLERRYKFHALRHFCASSMLAAAVPSPAVAGYLGDTLETLQRTYAHWLRDDADVPADALESILVVSRVVTPAAVADADG